MITNPDAPIFIVEGEKAAQRLSKLGLVATTSHGGAKKWQPVLNQYFAGRNVVVLADNDDAGREHADIVIGNLFGVANRIKRVELDGLPAKGDIVDWLDSGKGLDDLMAAVKAAPTVAEAPAVEAEAVEADGDGLDYFEFVGADYIRNMPPIEWAIGEGDDGIITENGLTVLYGAPGAGKSFIALDMALSIANGVEWQGMPTKMGKVLYIVGEGLAGIGKRLSAWEQHKGIRTNDNLHVLPIAVNFRDQSEVEKLMRSIDKAGSGWSIAFCDTVARSLVGADENSSQEMGLWVAAADSIKSHCKCAFVGVHHSGKNVANGMRGSSALLGAVDTSLVVTKDEEYVTIRVEKQKDATPVDDQAFRMTEVAMISGTSVVLERVSGDVQKKAKKVRPSKGAQEIAFMALQNLLIDRNEKQVHYDDWKAKHERNTPDSTADQRYQARRGLQAKGLVVIDDNKCWINSNLA